MLLELTLIVPAARMVPPVVTLESPSSAVLLTPTPVAALTLPVVTLELPVSASEITPLPPEITFEVALPLTVELMRPTDSTPMLVAVDRSCRH